MGRPSGGQSRLIAGSTVYLTSNLVNAAVPFLLLPVLTRVLGPAQYGQVAVFQALVGALAAFTGLSVAGAASRKYFDARVDAGELAAFIGTCLLIVAGSTVLTLLVLAPFLGPLSVWSGLPSSWLAWAVLVSAAGALVNLCLGQWQVREQAARYGALQVGIAVGLALLTLVLVVGLAQGAQGRIQAQVATMLGGAAVALFALRGAGTFTLAWRRSHLREALAFGVPLIPHVAGIFLLVSADRLVVQDALGLEAAGVYMVAAQLVLLLAILSDAFNKAYVPWLYERLKRNVADDKAVIVRGTYLYFATALAAAGALTLLAPWLLPWLAGDGYGAAVGLVGWLALGQAFNGMYLMVTNYVFFSKQTGWLSMVTIGSGLLNVALAIVLVRALGLRGAAIAFAATMVLRFLLTWAVAQKLQPMPWFSAATTVKREG